MRVSINTVLHKKKKKKKKKRKCIFYFTVINSEDLASVLLELFVLINL